MMRHALLRFAVLAVLLLPLGHAQAKNFMQSIGEADRAILNDLYNGRVIEAQPFGAQQNTGSLWKVKIEHEGRIREAIFKPRTYGDRDGWARTPMEVALYKLNRILGMDLVPPAAYRRNLTLNGNHFAEGALLAWVGDAHPVQNVPKKEWAPTHEAFASDLRILQMIARDADHENPKNIIRGKHWKDGQYRVMKVDNEACMRHGASVELHYNSAIWGQVNRFNPETYARLKDMTFDQLKGDVGEFLSDDEIREWLGTRDRLVKHMDKVAAEKGRQAVFFTPKEIGFDARRNVGKKAEDKDIAKFESLMDRKGVKVEYVSPGDQSLEGAVGKTVLHKDGTITVRLAMGQGNRGRPSYATLVEELVHVNQLVSMARRGGGLRALYKQLRKTDRKTTAVKASMEAYAKGKVKLTLNKESDKRKITKEQQKQQKKVVANAQVNPNETTTYWRTVGKPGAAARPANTARPVTRPPVRASASH